jgi:hypothetical protein
MAWRVDEVWLDADLLWFREERRTPFGAAALAAPAFAGDLLDRRLFAPVETGLEASRRRRLASRAARRRKLATRTVPAVALVLGSATMLPIAALRHGSAGAAGPLVEDPPSLTFRADEFGFHLPRKPAPPVRVERSRAELLSAELGSVSWQRATSAGLWFAGHLVDGTQLPLSGPDWVTWDPVTDRTPNEPWGLY